MSQERTNAANAQHMAEQPYRAFILTLEGNVDSHVIIVANDDQEASAIAEAMANTHAVELWCGLRFIERYDATQEADSTRNL